jgi:HEAT repeat protein
MARKSGKTRSPGKAGRRAAPKAGKPRRAAKPSGDDVDVARVFADLRSGDPDKLLAAAAALREVHDPAAVPDLLHMLSSKVDGMRMVAAHKLGDFNSFVAVDALVNQLNDAHGQVRAHAENSLRRITCRNIAGEGRWRAWWELRKKQLLPAGNQAEAQERRRLRQSTREFVDRQVRNLRGDDPIRREEAREKLHGAADPSAIAPLLELSTDASAEARRAAAALLGNFRDRRVVDRLIELLRDADVSIVDAARASLLRCTDQQFDNRVKVWLEWWKKARRRFPVWTED